MPKWEYRFEPAEHATDVRALNSLGAQGWELVAVTPTVCIFKRPVSADALVG